MTTKMLKETLECSEVLSRQWEMNQVQRLEIGKKWREFNPYSFLTVARGSSDHAAQYFNYLASLELGVLTTSLTPSLISFYKKDLNCAQSVAVAISQSGSSPDILAPMESFQKKKVETLALVNVESSPLSKIVSNVYPLCAGPEVSVAATKSFISSLFAAASLVAQTSSNQNLLNGLPRVSESLVLEKKAQWSSMIEILKDTKRALVVGRGLGFSIAHEAALKLKETCHIQAEAFSAAEIKHGPQAIVEKDYPMIIFALRGPTQKSLIELGHDMRNLGAKVVIISDQKLEKNDCLYTPTLCEELDPISAIQPFYLMVEELTRLRGLNPDTPRSLSKVTMTI